MFRGNIIPKNDARSPPEVLGGAKITRSALEVRARPLDARNDSPCDKTDNCSRGAGNNSQSLESFRIAFASLLGDQTGADFKLFDLEASLILGLLDLVGRLKLANKLIDGLRQLFAGCPQLRLDFCGAGGGICAC